MVWMVTNFFLFMFFTSCSIQENILETLSRGFVFNIAIEFNTFLLFLAAVSLALFPNKKLYKDRRNLGTQQKEKKKTSLHNM